MSPSLCSGVVVSRVRTSSSIHRFRRRFHRSRRFLVWWCTRLVVLWSPSSSFPPISFSGRPRQRWIGRWVSATPTSTMSSPTPPRPLWTKSSVVASKSNRKRAKEEEEAFWGRQNRRWFVRYASHSRKDDTKARSSKTPTRKKGKKKGNKMFLDTLCDAPGYARTCALHSSQVSYTPTVRPRATA